MIDGARARFELASTQATHIAALQAGSDDTAVHCVAEVVRNRFDGAGLVGAVGASLAAIVASPTS